MENEAGAFLSSRLRTFIISPKGLFLLLFYQSLAHTFFFFISQAMRERELWGGRRGRKRSSGGGGGKLTAGRGRGSKERLRKLKSF